MVKCCRQELVSYIGVILFNEIYYMGENGTEKQAQKVHYLFCEGSNCYNNFHRLPPVKENDN